MKKYLISIMLIVAIFIISSCSPKKVEANPPPPTVQPTIQNPQPSPTQPATELPSTVKANENAKIMILMYHGIGKEEQEWVRTVENFKKDLQTLYDKNYRIITLKDYLDNNIKVAAGFTPVILTFDDSLQNQFNMIEANGVQQIDPDCAVGILEAFFKSHPDFGRGASFYLFYPIPFRQKDLIGQKLTFLYENGYEIGNHSYNHEDLAKMSGADVQKSLAMNVAATQKYIPGYDVFSLALPYGTAPKGADYQYIISGTYQGTTYNNRAILKVGSTPAFPANNINYDPTKLPRVRASEMKTGGTGLYDWLKYYDKHPEKRYVSDGNPDTITIPESEAESINQQSLKDKKLIIQKQ